MSRLADRERFGRRDGLGVLGVAFALRELCVLWAGKRFPPAADGTYYTTIAHRIADGAGYTWQWPDGAVTYAGHYPIGLPALVALVFRTLGDDPRVVGTVFALVGALGAVAIAFVAANVAEDRRTGWVAGLAIALHPGLVLYTPAIMTEGLTASTLSFALAAFVAAQTVDGRRRAIRLVAMGMAIGAATLLRPQSLVLAPLLGAAMVAGWRIRIRRAAAVLVVALAVCAPWTARNCHRMGRCALVSYNGGFNLLIGTDETARGAWAEVKVPVACREVFDEAEKDACFGRAAARTIVADPVAWMRLAPAKLARTFDYAGAGPWYLHAANPDAFSLVSKQIAGAIETVFERLLLVLAVVEAARRVRRRVLALGLGAVAVAFCFVEHAAVSVVVLLGLWGLAARDAPRPRGIDLAVLAIVGSTALLHVVFFGAGRYGLVVFPFVVLMASFLAAPRVAPAPAPPKPV